jgi:hypothetical protein
VLDGGVTKNFRIVRIAVKSFTLSELQGNAPNVESMWHFTILVVWYFGPRNIGIKVMIGAYHTETTFRADEDAETSSLF